MKKSLFLLLPGFLPLVAAAQEKLDLVAPFSGTTEVSGPAEYIAKAYQYGLWLGALLAMTMIVIGAVQYTLSEAITSKEDAKDRIMKAVWGLVLLIAATLILNTINPNLSLLTDPSI